MLSALEKILERVFNIQLKEFFEENDVVCKNDVYHNLCLMIGTRNWVQEK